MHLLRTRAYVPARPFWGSLTAELTRRLGSLDYSKVGEFLKNVMRFSYLYIFSGDKMYMPRYTEEGLKFGDLTQTEFEKRFISSLASTSIEPHSLTAEEGTLHEVEFICPYEICEKMEKPRPVFLKGLLWVSEGSKEELRVQIGENNFSIANGKTEIMFSDLANTLQVGGERKYGFGQLRLKDLRKIEDRNLENLGFKGRWEETGSGVSIELEKNEFIWSHAEYNPKLEIKGDIEPIIGRDWGKEGAGRELKAHGLCWVPGSVLMKDTKFIITEKFGIWKAIF
ncbi:MAG: RAMP superfamily CRISPR-associated protein [Candidatus Methanodesulfokora sp.]